MEKSSHPGKPWEGRREKHSDSVNKPREDSQQLLQFTRRMKKDTPTCVPRGQSPYKSGTDPQAHSHHLRVRLKTGSGLNAKSATSQYNANFCPDRKEQGHTVPSQVVLLFANTHAQSPEGLTHWALLSSES